MWRKVVSNASKIDEVLASGSGPERQYNNAAKDHAPANMNGHNVHSIKN